MTDTEQMVWGNAYAAALAAHTHWVTGRTNYAASYDNHRSTHTPDSAWDSSHKWACKCADEAVEALRARLPQPQRADEET